MLHTDSIVMASLYEGIGKVLMPFEDWKLRGTRDRKEKTPFEDAEENEYDYRYFMFDDYGIGGKKK